jgi:tetratricopeptide (TPR) repeat protein
MRYHSIEANRRFEAVLAAVQTSGEAFPPLLLARAYHRAAIFASQTSDNQSVQPYLEEAIRLARLADDQEEQIAAQQSLGGFFYGCGDFINARRLLEEVLVIRRSLGQHESLASPLITLGIITQMQHDFVISQAYIDEGIAIHHEVGNLAGECSGLIALAWQHLLQHDLPSARRTFLRALALEQQLQTVLGIAGCLEGLALIDMVSEGEAETGARLYGAAQALREELGMPVDGPDLVEYTPFLEQGKRALGQAAWEKALEAGRRMEKEEAIRLAEGQ